MLIFPKQVCRECFLTQKFVPIINLHWNHHGQQVLEPKEEALLKDLTSITWISKPTTICHRIQQHHEHCQQHWLTQILMVLDNYRRNNAAAQSAWIILHSDVGWLSACDTTACHEMLVLGPQKAFDFTSWCWRSHDATRNWIGQRKLYYLWYVMAIKQLYRAASIESR